MTMAREKNRALLQEPPIRQRPLAI